MIVLLGEKYVFFIIYSLLENKKVHNLIISERLIIFFESIT